MNLLLRANKLRFMKNQNLMKIEEAWFLEVPRFNAMPGMRRLLNGDFTVAHYQSLLREIYFYARESPPFFAAILVHLRGAQRAYIKQILQHASSETGHDELALADLRALGVNTENIPNERPLPATSALIGFSFYLIQYLNPVSYLGFVFHLEYLPTHFGQQLAQGFLRAGVPERAMTFLLEHVEADVGHNRLMADYVENLLLNQRDVDDTIYAMQVTSVLFANLVEAAFRRVDEADARDYGINHAELAAHLLPARLSKQAPTT